LWVFGISRTKWPSRRFSGASSHLSPLERRSTAEIPRLWNFFYGLKGKTATSARSFSEIPSGKTVPFSALVVFFQRAIASEHEIFIYLLI
jgi:hypothetical protein